MKISSTMFFILILFAGLVWFSFEGEVHAGINDGLVTRYTFSGNLNDATGNGNNGTAPSGGITFESGKVGLGAVYDGGNSCIEIPETTELDGFDHFTYALWIRPDRGFFVDGVRNRQDILYKGNGYRREVSFVLNYDDYQDHLVFVWYATADRNSNRVVYQSDFPANQWFHFAFIYDGNPPGTMYINGQAVGTDSLVSTGSMYNDENSPLKLGIDFGMENQYFQGAMDEFRIYDRALSGDEITELYQSGNTNNMIVTYDYDNLNRVTSAVYGEDRIEYTYDSAGNILQVSTPSGCETLYYRDADGDGFGDPLVSQRACGPISGFVTDNTDCNDDPSTGVYEHPGQTWYPDIDGDGYYSGVPDSFSCTRPANHYAASELAGISVQDNCPQMVNPDQADYDSDGIGDACDSFFTDGQYYQDTDGDDIADEWEMARFGNLTTADATTDTDQDGILDIDEFKIDYDPTQSIYQGYISQETYEQDVNELIEYGSYMLLGDYDQDGDVDAFDLNWFSNEFGRTEIDVDNDGDGYSEIQGDCDDTDNSINSDESEICDGVDNNCNGIIDEGCE